MRCHSRLALANECSAAKQALTRAESQWKNRTMRSGEMSKEEAQFWRLQRYAYTWPPPWLAQMQNQSNPVVFLDVAVHALDRSRPSRAHATCHARRKLTVLLHARLYAAPSC